MSLLPKLIFSFISNAISLLAAAYFVTGFQVNRDLRTFILVTLLFTALNIIIRPILKLILSPVIILTLGLGIILVNAIVLYLLDYFSTNVSIDNITSLIYATLIISIVNILFHFSAKSA